MEKKSKLIIISIITVVLVCLGIFIVTKFVINNGQEAHSIETELVGLSYNGIYEDVVDKTKTDTDNDGLTDEEEENLGTVSYSVDSDGDGLFDDYEVNTSKSNPLEYDTDSDGLSDGDEIAAGLDPNNEKTNGVDKDTDVKFSVTYICEECSLKVNGNAEVYDVTIGAANLNGINTVPGVISSAFEFHTDESFESATVSFDYSDINTKGADEGDLCIYQIKSDGSFEKVKSNVNRETKMVSAKLEHFSKYVLCDTKTLNEDAVPQIYLLIDDSGSMYPDEVYEGSDENDVDFKRVDMAKRLVNQVDSTWEIGLATFTKDYFLLNEMGSSKDAIVESLEGIKTGEKNFNGTYIETSLMETLDKFEYDVDPDHRRYIVMLTDGKSTEGLGGIFDIKWYENEDIIKKANQKNVCIICISLTNKTDTQSLVDIAEGTCGICVNVNDADALDQVENKLLSTIDFSNNEYGDFDETTSTVADSGFTVEDNAFPYRNYMVITPDGDKQTGECFGIAAFSALYYSGRLPVSMEAATYECKSLIYIASSWYVADTFSAPAYDLSDTYFSYVSDRDNVLSHSNMANYKNSTLETFNKIYAMDDGDKYYVKDGELYFSQEVLDIIDNADNPLITVDTLQLPVEKEFDGKKYSSTQKLFFNLYNIDENSLTDEQKSDYNVAKAILALHYFQNSEELYNKNYISYVGDEKYIVEDYSYDDNFTALLDILKTGIPTPICACEHAINAISVKQDNDNTSLYYMSVYDNNYPGETRMLELREEVNKSTRNGLTRIIVDYLYDKSDYYYLISDTSNSFTSDDEEISLYIHDLRCFEN